MLPMSRISSPSSLAVAGLLASFQLGAADDGPSDYIYSGSFGTGHSGNFKYAPWRLDNDLYSELLNNQTNATGSYPLSGPDTSAPAPDDSSGSAPVEGWAWNIRVRADIPISLSSINTSYPPEVNADFFTGTEITLEAPPNTEVDPSWLVCTLQWHVDDNYSDELRQDDGTCSSVLSDSCRSDLADAVAEIFTTSSDTARCGCPSLSEISSCGTPPLAFNQACTATTYNATEINNDTDVTPGSWSGGQLYMHSYGGKHAAKGDVAAYNQTGSIAWPIMAVWGSSSLRSIPSTQLTCIRAANATGGSLVPGMNFTGNGGSSLLAHDQKRYTMALAGMLAAVWMTMA